MSAEVALVVTTSAWARDSPPLARLYEAFDAEGVEVRDGDLSTFSRAARPGPDHRDVFHLNWLDHLAGPGRRPLRALAAAKLVAVLALARLRGRHVWWTVHNLQPHEHRRSTTYAVVLPVVHLLVSTVHHLSESTARSFERRHPRVARLGRSKVVTTPMPSSGHRARSTVPAPAPDRATATFVAFGLLRPSKGVEELLTSFVAAPDVFSVIVALLAGVAGTLSLTGDKSGPLVGVFISVTTVPAAANIAAGIATGQLHTVAGAAAQLALNLVCILIAAVLTLQVQRMLWSRTSAPAAAGPRVAGR